MNLGIHLYVKSMGTLHKVKRMALSFEDAEKYTKKHPMIIMMAQDLDSGVIFMAEKYSANINSNVLPN